MLSHCSRRRLQLMSVAFLGVTMAATSCTGPVSSDTSDLARSDSGTSVVLDTSVSPSAVDDRVGSVVANLELRLGSPPLHGDASNSVPINDVAVDADHRVATAASDGVVGLYELSGSSPTSVPLVHPEGHVDGVAFDPLGGRLATGIAERRASSAFDDTVSLWDVANAERLIHVGGEADPVAGCSSFRNVVDWAHDGTFITSTSHDFTVSMIDPDTGRTLHTFAPHGNTVLDTAISPDDRWLVTSGDDSTMRVWDIESKDLIAEHQVTMGGYWSMVFLPDGTSLVVSDIVGNVWVVDALSGEITATFDGTKRRTASIAVSPDGHLVAAGADNSVVRLWSTDTGEILVDLVGHDGPVNAVAFFDDGDRLVSGSQDGTAIVWHYVTSPTP